jgi:hypothetical protein
MVGRLLAAVATSLIGSGVVRAYRFLRESNLRKKSPLQFTDDLTQEDFIRLVNEVARTTPRLTEAVATGLTVAIEVRSNSGLTSWRAVIDFHDFGRPTGQYWIHTENKQSPIPLYFAKEIQRELRQRFHSSGTPTSS